MYKNIINILFTNGAWLIIPDMIDKYELLVFSFHGM